MVSVCIRTYQSRYLQEYVRLHGKQPIRWCSVEVLNENRYSTPSDVWAYGVVCWEIIADGEVPHEDCENLVMVAERITNGFMLLQPSGCPTAVYTAMMIPCWERDPRMRPSFAELEHRAQSLGGVVTNRLAHDTSDANDTPQANRPSYFLEHETAHAPGVHGSYTLSMDNPTFDRRNVYENNDDLVDPLSSDVEDDIPLL